MAMRRSRLYSREVWSILVSLVVSFCLTTWLRISVINVSPGSPKDVGCKHYVKSELNGGGLQENLHQRTSREQPVTTSKLLFVGVMTAEKYLSTRCLAVHKTWANTIPGKVMCFTSGTSKVNESLHIPVVKLPSVDDSYPPQKKSFMMLKYIHDNYIDEYEWFMRADDDVYVRGDKMETFLRSINSSKTLFMGQAGLGSKEEEGLLNLKQGENFCMGGPGMIFSRETLRRMIPHISYCLKNLWSTHEDVEVGRCVKKFAGVDCTWSFEMQSLFYNNYSQSDLAYTGNLRTADVHKAITLHPVKRTPYMYRLHTYLMSVKGMDYQLKKIHLHREILSMKHILNENIDSIGRKFDEVTNKLGLKPGLVKYTPEKHEDVLAWQFLSKFTFSEKTDLPRKSNSKSLISAMEDIILQIMLLTNANSMKVGRVIDFKEILYGYSRVVPHYGVDYILDLLLIYNKHKGKTRKLPVRRHIYVQQTFGEIEFIDNDELSKKFGKGPESLALNSHNILSPVKSLYYLNQRRQVKEAIHFIMPLSGRYETFQRFMSNFEQTCLLPRENVKLLVVLFKAPENDPSSEIEQLIASYQVRYPWTELRVLHAIGGFSRGLALQLGASQYLSNALMFFVDVDMYLSEGFLGRCRENTQLGKQVYFPEVFSQYNPNVVYGQNMRPNSPLVIGKDLGFFRHYGFGLVCLYNEDLNRVGGMDASIVGWGLEDVDLFQKFVSSNITIFRAPDPGLVHIYHSVECDENIDQRQYHMCLGSKAGTYASNAQLVKILGKYKEEANGKQ